MPRGNYSYSGEGTGALGYQPPFAISEPENGWIRSERQAGPQYAEQDEIQPIQAKEPDRQGAARRGSQSSRGRGSVEEGYSQGTRSRGKAAQRGTARRGSQARKADRGQSARRSTTAEPRTTRQKKSRRGFAAMSPEQQREIARKGGLTVSRNRRHMADIGRIGGEHSHGGRRSRR